MTTATYAFVAVLLIAAIFMRTNAKSKFDAMVPGFDDEFLDADNGLTDEQKELFLELTSLHGHYDKRDLRELVETPGLVEKITRVVREMLRARGLPEPVLDFFDHYLDITHRLEVASGYPPERRVSTVYLGFTRTLDRFRQLSDEDKEHLYKYDETMEKLEKLWGAVINQAVKMCKSPLNKAVCKNVNP